MDLMTAAGDASGYHTHDIPVESQESSAEPVDERYSGCRLRFLFWVRPALFFVLF